MPLAMLQADKKSQAPKLILFAILPSALCPSKRRTERIC